jgi:hypothetical protein
MSEYFRTRLAAMRFAAGVEVRVAGLAIAIGESHERTR